MPEVGPPCEPRLFAVAGPKEAIHEQIVTISLEMSDPDASQPFIDAAHAAAEGTPHTSLLDPEHRMDALFGVVNIPNVIWIDWTNRVCHLVAGRDAYESNSPPQAPEYG